VKSALILALPLLLWRCASSPGENVRAATYPPSFEYITRGEIRSSMGRLARVAAELDAAVRSDPPADPGRVVTLLDEMDRAASDLDRDGSASNHPLLGSNLARFRRDLEGARAAARADPPSLYLAGTVVGSCSYCHR
jgi:hypothetical protein